MAQLVATKVNGVVMTSSPGLMLSNSMATCRAEVPLLKPSACWAKHALGFDMQGGSADVGAERVLGPAEIREVPLKLHYIRAQAKAAIIQGFGDGGVQFFAQRTQLRGQIEIRYGLVHAWESGYGERLRKLRAAHFMS